MKDSIRLNPSTSSNSNGLPARGWPVGIFLLVFFVVGLVGYSVYRQQKSSLKRNIQNQMRVISDLKGRQLENWLRERKTDIRVVSSSYQLAHDVEVWAEAGRELKEQRKRIENRLRRIQQYARSQYGEILVFDKRGAFLTSNTGTSEALELADTKIVQEVIQEQKALFSPLHFRGGIATQPIDFDLAAPLIVEDETTSRVVGAVLFEIDPGTFLFPLVQSWPLPSETAETLLVTREGDSVVFLNDLRHRRQTALNLRFLVQENSGIPAVMAVEGKEGIVEGVDYRGVPVLAAIRAVTEMPWFLIAKIDQDEVYAPLRQYLFLFWVFLGISAVVVGLLIRMGWRRRVVANLTREKETAQRYLNIAGVLIVAFDTEGQILLINRKGCEILGYDESELLGRNWFELCVPDSDRSRLIQLFGSLTSADTSSIECLEGAVLTRKGEERILF
jgi:PAS domain S-box-containing protein